MKTAAIICEYNPFHNGHLYQINKIKEELNPDFIVCIMSGDFVQRGEISLFSKEFRTKSALMSGVDLVLLLPTIIATGAADLFSYGAVNLLNRLHAIDYLCFGAECSSLEYLINASDNLYNKGTIDSPEIKKLMATGLTFPQARASLFPEYTELLSGSNNILALEYLMALKKCKSKMTPYLIKREGSLVNDNVPGTSSLASATSIRNLYKEENIKEALNYIPQNLYEDYSNEKPLYNECLSSELRYKLLNETDFSDYLEVSDDLSDRILKTRSKIAGFDEAVTILSARNFTESRIKRALIHILLNINGCNDYYKERTEDISHIRILGFNRRVLPLLHEIKDKNDLIPVTKIKDVYSSFNEATRMFYDKDTLSFALYDGKRAAITHEEIINENSKEIIIL